MSSGERKPLDTHEIDKGMVRALGLKEAVTITAGTVIGVGLFTVGSNAVGWLGPTIILATLVAFLLSLYPSLLYAEMGAALPFAGGTYNYAALGLGRVWGFLAAWNFVISLIAVATGEALAFSNYFKWMLEGLGVPLNVDERIIAAAVLIIFIYINWKGIESVGKWQNAFMFFFWGCALAWFLVMLKDVKLSYFKPFAPLPDTKLSEFILATSLVWWCFAGFETAVAMGSEIKYPQVNIPRAMFLSPFVVFCVNAIFQWFLVGITPPNSLTALREASAPYAEAMKLAGIAGLPLVLLCLGIAFGGDMSTINPSIAAPARYLYRMSADGVIPDWFSRLHPKFRTPHIAIAFLGIIMLILISTGSIIYVATISLFADLLYYVIGFAAAIGLRRKRPDLERPYRAPWLTLGSIICIIAYIVMMTQLPTEGVWTGAIWCGLGLLIYWLYSREGALKGVSLDKVVVKLPPMPSKDVKELLDREFKIWKIGVGIAFFAVILLYILPLFVR
ncbi:MAG: amino acid permease [Synergistetes bacterium]|nr:amino acid permease [Synergistota bacterium]MDW8192886.1 amino acid permease [Synergistota bacterium]